MANTIKLSPVTTPGLTHVEGLSDESAKISSDFLTINHALYHTRWKATFHNHIAHHILALWALGASPGEIREMWNYNEPYQTPMKKASALGSPAADLRDKATFEQCLGKDDSYADFLSLFEEEISKNGIEATLREYLLKNDDRSNSILCRMFSDLLHPAIHLGCGLEFKQPSIIAEALAGACVHEFWPAKFLIPTEQYIRLGKAGTPKPLLETINALRKDERIRNGVKHTDPFNKIADGLLIRVEADELSPYLGQFRLDVEPGAEELQTKTSDLMYTCAYMLGAAQQPNKREAMDFITLHTATMSAFYPVIVAQGWLSGQEKARILEFGARTSAVMYAACGDPQLHAARIQEYAPRRPSDGWPELFRRAILYHDEGHAAKLMRALYCTEQMGDPPAGFPISRAGLVKIAHMAMDSIEVAFDGESGNRQPAAAPGIMQRVGSGGEMVVDNMTRWVYYGGLEKAWDHIPETQTV